MAEYCAPCSIGYNVILHFEKLKVMTLRGMKILDASIHFKILISAKIPIINGRLRKLWQDYDTDVFNKKASLR